MEEKKRHTKQALRLQSFPFFEDYKTYDLALTWSNKLRIRMNRFILDAINDWCKKEKIPEVQYESPKQLHDILVQFAHKSNRSLPNFVEIRVAEYGIKLTKESLPVIK